MSVDSEPAPEQLFEMDLQTVLSNSLLFLLIAGMAGSCDAVKLRTTFTSFKGAKGIVAGIVSQYVVLPILGFVALQFWQQDPVVIITLLVVTTSPGGGFSGWWCSLSNADLALSVAMTSASTLACIVFLPFNVWMYSRILTPDMDVVIAWNQLFLSVIVVVCAVIFGSLSSYYVSQAGASSGTISAHGVRQGMNTLGSAAGVFLMIFGGASNGNSDSPFWNNDADWFLCIAMPCVLGLISAVFIAFRLDLEPPSCVAVAIECAYQNTGLALTIALSAVPADKVGLASGVPIFYGIVEIICVPVFALTAWKLDWTYAKPNDNICKVLVLNHQPGTEEGELDVDGTSRSYEKIEEVTHAQAAAAHAARKWKENTGSGEGEKLQDSDLLGILMEFMKAWCPTSVCNNPVAISFWNMFVPGFLPNKATPQKILLQLERQIITKNWSRVLLYGAAKGPRITMPEKKYESTATTKSASEASGPATSAQARTSSDRISARSYVDTSRTTSQPLTKEFEEWAEGQRARLGDSLDAFKMLLSGYYLNLSLVAALLCGFTLATLVATPEDARENRIIRYGIDVTENYVTVMGISGGAALTLLLWCVADCIAIDGNVRKLRTGKQALQLLGRFPTYLGNPFTLLMLGILLYAIELNLYVGLNYSINASHLMIFVMVFTALVLARNARKMSLFMENLAECEDEEYVNHVKFEIVSLAWTGEVYPGDTPAGEVNTSDDCVA